MQVVFHEYAHLVVSNVMRNVPVWLNEGLAEYYSTYEMRDGGREAVIGRADRPASPAAPGNLAPEARRSAQRRTGLSPLQRTRPGLGLLRAVVGAHPSDPAGTTGADRGADRVSAPRVGGNGADAGLAAGVRGGQDGVRAPGLCPPPVVPGGSVQVSGEAGSVRYRGHAHPGRGRGGFPRRVPRTAATVRRGGVPALVGGEAGPRQRALEAGFGAARRGAVGLRQGRERLAVSAIPPTGSSRTPPRWRWRGWSKVATRRQNRSRRSDGCSRLRGQRAELPNALARLAMMELRSAGVPTATPGRPSSARAKWLRAGGLCFLARPVSQRNAQRCFSVRTYKVSRPMAGVASDPFPQFVPGEDLEAVAGLRAP